MDSTKPIKITVIPDGRMDIADFGIDPDSVKDKGSAVKDDPNTASESEILDDSVFDIGPGTFPFRQAQEAVKLLTQTFQSLPGPKTG